VGDLELAHMLSYHMVKTIVTSQIFVPQTDAQHRTIDEIVRLVRGIKGDIYLCDPCHEYSDKVQKEMEQVLESMP